MRTIFAVVARGGPATLATLVLFMSAASIRSADAVLSTQGDQILYDGKVVQLKGLSWFGFNNGQTMLDGMWNSSNPMSFDLATVIYRWQLLGLNAIRVPFSMVDLYTLAPRNKVSTKCGPLPTSAQIAASVVDPAVTLPAGSASSFPPPISWPDHGNNSTCNGYLPNNSTMNRFVWTVQYLARNGFFVIIDNHFEDPTVTNDAALWRRQWVDIVARVSSDPVTAGRLIVDILNEPDGRGWGWDVMKSLYLGVMDDVYKLFPGTFFLIEGCGQAWSFPSLSNWGDGFAMLGVNPGGPSDPVPFFQALMGKPYLNQVALGPHVYGPTITGASSGYNGTGLWTRLTKSFGTLTKQGFTYNGIRKTFPVVIGETGSKMTDPRDLQFLNDFSLYLRNIGAAADGLHNPIQNVIWWAWNDNAGKTGGIVDSTWVTILWPKIRWLVTTVNLQPWYLAASAPRSLTPPAGIKIVAANDPISYPAPSSSGRCSATVSLVSPPQATASGVILAVNVRVRNLGPLTIPSGWTFSMTNPAWVGRHGPTRNFILEDFYGQNGTFVGTVSESWQALKANGGSTVSLGLNIASSSPTEFVPWTFSVNGGACEVIKSV